MPDLVLLTIFVGLFTLLSPFYMILRNKMVLQAKKRKHPLSYYSKKRIFKIAITILLLMLPTLILMSGIFITIKLRTGSADLSQNDLPFVLAFFIASLFVAYGSGIYIVSVIKEEFTKEDLTLDPKFVLEYITNEFFHGPVSHVMIFSGAVFLLLIISLFELSYPTNMAEQNYLILYALDGVVLGISLALSHFYNDTWKHQLIWTIIALLIHQSVLVTGTQVSFYEIPFNLFFAIFTFVLNITLLGKLIWYHAGRAVYKYEQEEKSLTDSVAVKK